MPFVSPALFHKRTHPQGRALLPRVFMLLACASALPLAGCGSAGYTAPGFSQPVTSGTRLLFDTQGVSADMFASGIDTIAPDGSGFQQIIKGGLGSGPHFSRDGRKIVYVGGSGVLSLVVANADGSGPVSVYRSDPGSDPSFRPDGKALVFVNNGSKLYTVNVDGTQPRQIAAAPSGYALTHPTYTPDGTRIVYEQDPPPTASDTPKLRIINADGSGSRAIGSDFSITPAFSPDSKRIAYAGYDNSDKVQGIFLSSVESTAQSTLLLQTNGILPVFSPDGAKIAFLKPMDNSMTINGSPAYEIHIVNADGTGETRVGTQAAVATTTLDWR